MMTRQQSASAIRDFRYAVRTGACRTASFHLKLIAADSHLPDSTMSRLVRTLKRCRVAAVWRRRR